MNVCNEGRTNINPSFADIAVLNSLKGLALVFHATIRSTTRSICPVLTRDESSAAGMEVEGRSTIGKHELSRHGQCYQKRMVGGAYAGLDGGANCLTPTLLRQLTRMPHAASTAYNIIPSDPV